MRKNMTSYELQKYKTSRPIWYNNEDKNTFKKSNQLGGEL